MVRTGNASNAVAKASAAATSSGAEHLELAPPSIEDSDTSGPAGDEVPLGGPALSLEQLGIGASNPFRGLAPAPLKAEQLANRRLQASLRQGAAERDRQRRLGSAGAVLGAARRLVSASETLVETSAVLNVRVDGAGRVTTIEVLEASGQADDWRMMADSLRRALESATLRLGTSPEAFGLKLRIGSAMRLPSGAAPGLRLGLLGQTLQEGGGPSSTSINVSPSAPLRRDEVFDTTGRHADQPMQFELGLLELKGDVADTAAPARRVVEIAVLSLDVGGAVHP